MYETLAAAAAGLFTARDINASQTCVSLLERKQVEKICVPNSPEGGV
jgi:hypothetical protein